MVYFYSDTGKYRMKFYYIQCNRSFLFSEHGHGELQRLMMPLRNMMMMMMIIIIIIIVVVVVVISLCTLSVF